MLKKQESYFSDACSPAFNGAKKQNKTKNKAKAKKDNAPDLELWTAHMMIHGPESCVFFIFIFF